MPRIIHLILNPAAGKGRSGRRLREVLHALQEANFAVEEYVTARRMHAAEIAAALPDDGAPLCVAGGDGTLNEVINGLRPGAHPVGVLPLGTGNDFATLMGARSMKDTLDAVLRDRRRTVDAAKVDLVDEDGMHLSRRFVNAVGIGFHAACFGITPPCLPASRIATPNSTPRCSSPASATARPVVAASASPRGPMCPTDSSISAMSARSRPDACCRCFPARSTVHISRLPRSPTTRPRISTSPSTSPCPFTSTAKSSVPARGDWS